MNIPDRDDVKGFAGTDPTQAPPLNQVQDLTLNLIRELVDDGLFVLGVPDRKEPSGFELWDLPIDAAMAEIKDAYVKNFHDRWGWSHIVCMNPTAIGQQLALELYKSSEPWP